MDREHFSRRSGQFATTSLCLVLGSLVLAPPALARDWFVDGRNGRSTNPGTGGAPFLYFWQADQLAKPGDNIYLLPTTTYSTLWIGASGSQNAPITISGAGSASNLTKVSGLGANFGIFVGASYIVVQHFDVTAPGPYAAIHAPQDRHHIVITDNRLHDAGGNGVDMIGNDYVTISYNTVYGNARNTSRNAFGSGISVKGGIDIDSSVAAKMQIYGNVVYANTNTPTCATPTCVATDSDGSGIIVDNQRRSGIDNRPYHGWTLVANNLVFGNGGRGIHMYLSDHVSVNGNTSYWNNQDPHEGNYQPGEIEANNVSDVTITNNIAYSDGSTPRNFALTGAHEPIMVRDCAPGSGPVLVAGNLGYEPSNDPADLIRQRYNTGTIRIAENYWGDPRFERRTLDATLADFRVELGSPALGHGTTTYSMYVDLTGARRFQPTTIGAYENAGP